MLPDCAEGLKSRAQIARRVTEQWGATELFCVACSSARVHATTANTPAVDFVRPKCGAPYQLKAGKGATRSRVPDGAHSAMLKAIRSDATPHLVVMQYTPKWHVINLVLVPRFFLTETVIQARRPTLPKGRSAPWIGCDIMLRDIVEDGKIRLVTNALARSAADVRADFNRVRRLASVPPAVRGWTLDVLAAVRDLRQARFTLSEVYAFEDRLSRLHPQNRNVRPKIRQQLQVLRDVGLIRFAGRGQYEIVEAHET